MATKLYTVVPGDYLVKIAKEHGTTVDAIWGHDLNERHRQKRGSPDVLYAGDVLHIPVPDPVVVDPPPAIAPPPPESPLGADPCLQCHYGRLPLCGDLSFCIVGKRGQRLRRQAEVVGSGEVFPELLPLAVDQDAA